MKEHYLKFKETIAFDIIKTILWGILGLVGLLIIMSIGVWVVFSLGKVLAFIGSVCLWILIVIATLLFLFGIGWATRDIFDKNTRL